MDDERTKTQFEAYNRAVVDAVFGPKTTRFYVIPLVQPREIKNLIFLGFILRNRSANGGILGNFIHLFRRAKQA